MKTYSIALIGFGGVSRALVELLRSDGEAFAREFGFRLKIVGIADLHLGTVIADDGIDLQALAALRLEDADFARLAGGSAVADSERVIRRSCADIVVEATYTNPANGEPAISHCRWALESGRHVVTTNKGPIALAGRPLKELAAARGLAFEFEGVVMSGTPILRLAKQALSGAGLIGFEGILNGTSNFVLGRMEAGLPFDEAVREAQALGYAEANPAADVEGHDVRLKVAILANELLGATLTPNDIPCEGITGVTEKMFADAAAAGRRWKLLGTATSRPDGTVQAVVAPRMLPLEHPLSGISGATNAVSFDTRLLGKVSVTGPGAGQIETAYAVLSDILSIHRAGAPGRKAAA